jgi:hypothetical protein
MQKICSLVRCTLGQTTLIALTDQKTNQKSKIWHILGLFAIIAVMGLITFTLPLGLRIISWLGSIVLLTCLALITSHGVTGLWRGFLIDERNKMSLSRLQTSLWTLVIFSAIFSAALFNIRNGAVDPLALSIPTGVWILAGINATSLVGTPLIHSYKQNSVNDTSQQAQAQPADVQPLDDLQSFPRGQLIVNRNPQSARWTDMFQGEEIGNASQLDLGKTQLFYFNIVLIVVYFATLGFLFASQARTIGAFPDLNDGLLALLGISNGAYLTNKAVPHN